MTISAPLAADLAILTAALDQPDADIAASLSQLAADGQAAVHTYLGLTVVISHSDPAFNFTTLIERVARDGIRTSLQMTLKTGGDGGAHARPTVAVIVHAGTPGTFIDLAADLAWLTGRPLSDFVLDRHLTVADEPGSRTPLVTASAVNQALGVLIGRGYTPSQADWQLDTQARHTGADRYNAACLILAKLTVADTDQDFDIH
jgi:hypothetical protein